MGCCVQSAPHSATTRLERYRIAWTSLWLKERENGLSSVCIQDPPSLTLTSLLSMRFLPVWFLIRSMPFESHAFQLGSEAMVPPWPVVLPRGFDVAGSVIPVTERVKGAEQRTTPTHGDQEVGKLNGLPSRSEAGKPMSVPPLARYWKLNLLGLLLLLGSICSPSVAHDAPVRRGRRRRRRLYVQDPTCMGTGIRTALQLPCLVPGSSSLVYAYRPATRSAVSSNRNSIGRSST